MVVVNAVAIRARTPALGKSGKQEKRDRAVAKLVGVFGFIPSDDQRATLLVGFGLENQGNVPLQPCVGSQGVVGGFGAITRGNTLMSVMTGLGMTRLYCAVVRSARSVANW